MRLPTDGNGGGHGGDDNGGSGGDGHGGLFFSPSKDSNALCMQASRLNGFCLEGILTPTCNERGAPRRALPGLAVPYRSLP